MFNVVCEDDDGGSFWVDENGDGPADPEEMDEPAARLAAVFFRDKCPAETADKIRKGRARIGIYPAGYFND